MTYIDGFICPVPAGTSEETYRAFTARAAAVIREHGALRVVENWGDDVLDDSRIDFHRAAQAREGETMVFSWIEWPDKATRDAGMAKAMEDPRLQPDAEPMPFEAPRLIYGGFRTIVDV